MPNKRSLRLLIFQFFPAPHLILRKLTFLQTSHFISLLCQDYLHPFSRNFHGKITCFCIYCSFMLYDNLFLLFPSLYSHIKPFLDFRSPSRLLNLGIYSDPLFIRTLSAFQSGNLRAQYGRPLISGCNDPPYVTQP